MMIDEASWIDRVLDVQYRVERVLGQGGMGIVLAVRDTGLNERFALKLLVAERAQKPQAQQRFMREADLATRIHSEHVARVHHLGRLATGELYILMECLEGKDLGTIIEHHGIIPFQEALKYALETCAGLAVAHGLGIVHRDIKPSNLFLAQRPDQDPIIKLIDFGISKLHEGELDLTQADAFLGSPLYMSPEQLTSARDTDARTDVFSLGAVLYQLLTGVAPFAGQSVVEIGHRILHATPDPPSELRPELPWQIDSVLERCLAKRPQDRFATIDELSNALRALHHPAEVFLHRLLDDEWEKGQGTPARATMTCSFTSSVAAGHLDRKRAIAARGYAGMPPAASPRRLPATIPPAAPPPTQFAVPRPRNPAFVGREAELGAIHTALWSSKPQSWEERRPRVLRVAGAAGTGKTELVSEYAHRHRDDYPGGVFWLELSAPDKAYESTGEEDYERILANQLELPKHQYRSGGMLRNAIEEALSKRGLWLLVFDAVDSKRAAYHLTRSPYFFHDETHSKKTPHVLFVGRATEDRYRPLTLGALDETLAFELLVSTAELHAPDARTARVTDAASVVARALSTVPLLLDVAATSLGARADMTAANALAELETLISAGAMTANAAEAGARAIFTFVKHALPPSVQTVLRTLAAWGEGEIRRERLARLAEVTEAQLSGALADLSRHGLLASEPAGRATRLRRGIATYAVPFLDINASFLSECCSREARALVDLPLLHGEINVHGFKVVMAELRHLLQLAPSAPPPMLDALVLALETEAPHLVDQEAPIPLVQEAPLPLVTFLVQIRDAAFEHGSTGLVKLAEAALRATESPWLRRRTHHEQGAPRLLYKHEGPITAVALSADGTRALSAAGNGALVLHDTATSTLIAELRGRSSAVSCVAMTPDARVAMSGSEDGSLAVWDLERRSQRFALVPHLARVTAVALCADGRRGVSAADDGFVCAWDTVSGRALRTFRVRQGSEGWPFFARALALSADGASVVIASLHGTLWFFDLDTGALVHSLELPEPPLGFVTARSHALIATRAEHGPVRLRDVRTGAVIHEIDTPTSPHSVAASSDAIWGVVASQDAIPRVHDLSTGELVRELVRHRIRDRSIRQGQYPLTGHKGRVTAVAASADGRVVLSGGVDNQVLAWDPMRGPAPRSGEHNTVITLTPDGERLLASGPHSTLVVWDVATALPIRSLKVHEGVLLGAFALADGRTISSATDGMLRVWDMSTGKTLHTLSQTGAASTLVSVSPDGRRAVTSSQQGQESTLVLWDIETSGLLRAVRRGARIERAKDLVRNARWHFGIERAVLLDAHRVLLCNEAGVPEIMDVTSGATVQSFDGLLEKDSQPLLLCSDKRCWFATPSGAMLVDIEEGRVLAKLLEPIQGRGREMAFASTPDGMFVALLAKLKPRQSGSFIATPGEQWVLRRWNVAADRADAELRVPFDARGPLALTPDGRTLIFGSWTSGSLEHFPRLNNGSRDGEWLDFELGRVHMVDLVC